MNDDLYIEHIGPEAFADFVFVGSPTISPNEDLIVGCVETIDTRRTGYLHQLWKFPRVGEASPLIDNLSGDFSDMYPQFSPFGDRVAFISNRDINRQVYSCDLDGENLRSFGTAPGDITAFAWIDNVSIVAISNYLTKDEAFGDPMTPGTPIRIDWLHYKSEGQSSYFEPQSDIFKLSDTCEPRLLLRCEGKVTNLAHANGAIAYSVDLRHSNRMELTAEVRRLDLSSGNDELLWDCPSSIEGIAITDISSFVVAVASGARGNGEVVPRLWLIPESGSPEILFPSHDIECEYAVQGDSRPTFRQPRLKSILGSDDISFVTTTGGDVALCLGSVAQGEVRRITGEGTSVTDFSQISKARVAICLEDQLWPSKLWITNLGKIKEAIPRGQRLPRFSKTPSSSFVFKAPENIEYMATDGLALNGFLYISNPGKARPLVTIIHGGPHLCYGSGFDLEVQLLLSHGFNVLLPNPRGSAGRGSEFRRMSVGEWGGMDYSDVMGFVDLVEKDPRVDESSLYLLGGSYGGFLVNWILTQTDRFKAVISERSISNLISKYGTSDVGFTVNRYEMAGADIFEESVKALIQRSPIFYANKVTTPVLLIHGENDKRCPIEQSEQFFIALRRLGKECEFIRFPEEGHSLAYSGRPDHRIQRMQAILGWLENHM